MLDRGMRLLLLLTGALTGCGADHFHDGVTAYKEGRFDTALRSFDAEELDSGDHASAELLFNKALAALGAGDLRAVELAAEKMAVRGGRPFYPTRDFLLGNAAFARCLWAEREAAQPEADPIAYDVAIAQARRALGHWQQALERRRWPAAARNVDRAKHKIQVLRDRKRRSEEHRKTKKTKEPKSNDKSKQPPRGKRPRNRRSQQAPAQQADPMRLSEEQLQDLLAKLQRKEQQKRALRRKLQAATRRGVEKDW